MGIELNIYRIRDEPGRGFLKPYVEVDFVVLDVLFFLFILVNLVTITVETLLTIILTYIVFFLFLCHFMYNPL